ncbi:peptidase M28 [Nitritalea halalkaliphila LW7]|uniref:Peptidase M28 n=1 Tax=Nitritalea halalkaliphila LW7 TaxID=1189621 RepID=I5C9M2_9BACT|nr:M20/M25/M40 family metallo-hydrolase [Nitritalea halalkaliphila]EIM78524.1 peptidase M28 [Nitritalea halalkaliphila LW7]
MTQLNSLLKHSVYVLLCFFLAQGAYAQAPATETEKATERLSRHVHILAADSMEGRGLGTEGRLKAIRYIESEMAAVGLQPLPGADSFRQEFELRIALINLKGINLVGMLPGSDPELREEYIVVGAHYDHLGYSERGIFPGADDNASGVAGILEIARMLQEKGEPLKRSILFVAFDAEESGLIGAEKFVEAAKPFPNSAIKAMFSLDMIGMYEKKGSLELKGLETLAEGLSLLERAESQHDIRIKGTAPTIERRTDTWPFGQVGIPAIYVNTGIISPYHTPQDKANLLDYPGMAKVSAFLSDLLTEMALAPSLSPIENLKNLRNGGSAKRLNTGAQFAMGNAFNRHRSAAFNSFGVVAFEAGLNAEYKLKNRLELSLATLVEWHGAELGESILRRASLTAPCICAII